MTVVKNKAYISVGSNIGDRVNYCRSAVNWLNCKEGIRVFAHSRYFETEPVGYADQQWFVNAVFAVETTLSPFALLKALQMAQRVHGREKTGIRFGPRVLDLDILFYNDMVINDPVLIIPHPRIVERRFVLQPLCDISPTLIHPGLGMFAYRLLEDLPEEGPACMPIDGKQ